MVYAAASVLLIGFWLCFVDVKALLFLGVQLARSHESKPYNGLSFRKLALVAPFARMLEKFGLYDWLQLPIGSYHMKLVILQGSSWTMERTRESVAVGAGHGYAAVTACAALSWLASEPLMLVIGILAGCGLTIRPFMNAARELERRRRKIVEELPLMMSKLMLLVGAGETVQGALMRCLEGKDADKHPLYKEWHNALASMRNGLSFQMALERFNRRCAVQETSVFTTVLLLNYRKGGEHFVLALRELSYTLWEKRKNAAKSRGEEASSKLVFPLVGILLVLMLLVASPAFLLMS